MIRKLSLLILVFFMFAYTAWNFYQEAFLYEPLGGMTVKKVQQAGSETAGPLEYKKTWSDKIHEKNLFSPTRTFKEPKPFVPPPPPPEPPKRPELLLKGIIQDSSGEYVAYIEIDKVKARPMRKGDMEQDIELVEISDRKAVLQWNNEKISLTLEKIKTIDNPRATK